MHLNLKVLNLSHLPLAGRLKHCITNWEQLCTDPWVLEAVHTYHLDFVEMPHQEKIPLPRFFSPEEMPLVEKEVQEMLAIHLVPQGETSEGFVSNISF